jgi:hypothetical protein
MMLRRRKTRDIGDNFLVNYDPKTTSYRCRRLGTPAVDPSEDIGCMPMKGASWIDDPNRIVRLSVAAWAGRDCLWRVEGGTLQKAPCVGNELQVQLKTKKTVTVQPADADGPVLSPVKDIIVQDVKIVALGESFSAGEGNPHSQWRLFSIHQRPAYWLDPRCHRSLMSGPSLAAAYVAYDHPYSSVTFLHYGCSGASIADGVATPWANLETSQGVDARWHSYQRFWFLVRRPTDQRTKPLNGDGQIHPPPFMKDQGPIDYPMSQIEQARADMGPIHPDLVLLSVGGNDVGFADIVQGMSLHSWDPDLTPERLKTGASLADLRLVASFDQTAWVAAAELDDGCTYDPKDPTPCVISRFHLRLGDDKTKGAGRVTLKSQYDLLRTAMKTLTDGPVFVTAYPNFVNYDPHDGDRPMPYPPPPKDQLKPCDDKPFDGRPGFVPTIVTLFSGLGIREKDTSRVDQFLDPLNETVGSQARGSWTVIDAHVATGQGHGYCSLARWYNTYGDSLWNQGYRPSTLRPLGNFRVALAAHLPDADKLRLKDGTALEAGDGVVWNAAEGCFTLFDGPRLEGRTGNELCVKIHGVYDPVFYGMSRVFTDDKPPTIGEPKDPKPGILDHGKTTGPIHPNLFGHCNYASAIINEIEKDHAPALAALLGDRAAGAPNTTSPLTVCSPEAWGFHTAAR